MFSRLIILIYLFFVSSAFAVPNGIYNNITQKGMKLELLNGKYSLWIYYQSQIINIQSGIYSIEGNYIFFKPQESQVGDFTPVKAEIVGNCKIKMGQAGVFKLENCSEKSQKKEYSHIKNFPNNWETYKTKEFEIFIPVGAKVKLKNNLFTINYKNSYGELKISQDLDSDVQKIFNKYKPEKTLQKGNAYFSICKNKEKNLYLQIVVKKGKENLVSFVESDNFADLKALSIAISSLKVFKDRKYADLVKWIPRDNSFSIKVPKDWFSSGGTADFGVNGYLRIIVSYPQDKQTGFLGFYYPFYQYAQTSYGSNGIPPMEPKDYVSSVFFQELNQRFNINFKNLRLDTINIDENLSKKLTEQTQQFFYQHGLNTKIVYKFVYGKGSFTENGKEYELIIEGIISYTTSPLRGVGYMYIWGASPLFVFSAEKGKMDYWYPLFEKVANSWQVNMQWLRQHYKNANIEAKQIIQHYRKMTRLIRENSEYRINLGLKMHEENEKVENEIFSDIWYALGGEERYDNPSTGEVIALPVGVDKYFYDNYSETWIGIKMDNPDAMDIVNELKNNGFVELKKHRY
jgi:hypothetical protein